MLNSAKWWCNESMRPVDCGKRKSKLFDPPIWLSSVAKVVKVAIMLVVLKEIAFLNI